MSAKSVFKILQANCGKLKARYNLSYIGVFGSYSRGEETLDSDLDILYEALPNTSVNRYNYIFLKAELHKMTGLKIDLVNKKSMNPAIWANVKKDVIIY